MRMVGLGFLSRRDNRLLRMHARTAVALEAQLDWRAESRCHGRAIRRSLRKKRAEDHRHEPDGESSDQSGESVLIRTFFRRYRNHRGRIQNATGLVGELLVQKGLINLSLQLGHL